MTTVRVTIQEIGGGKTRMSIESEFPTVEAMEQLAAMGVEEGRTQAVGQIEAILAEGRDQPSLRKKPRGNEVEHEASHWR